MQKPRIGITMRLELETRRFYLGRDYSEAIEGLGGIPSHISLIPNRDYIADFLSHLDGILLPGSDTDVDPHRFGEEPHPKLKKIIPEKDETDLLVLEIAEELNIPILAICFGMQVLNVFRGGTLIQDIEGQIPNNIQHEQGVPLERGSHSIEVENDSVLRRLITARSVRVNSHHHQAIREVGKNLKATAWAKDGVIESIEDTRENRFVLGVQWHPELSWKNDQLSRQIFETFIGKCK
ncbi:MAG TPA: gamma-glutamyl-gamma-aminobutyrate hydrolase family protein [Pyrinomonadaceae bacterium]|nr:gamma-glutamyl-gamma-aminobutyrate hydrolase family protein [Pyrinomonadaceae bacterium]